MEVHNSCKILWPGMRRVFIMPYENSSSHILMIYTTHKCCTVQVYEELKWCFYNVCVCVHAGERSVPSQAAPQLFPNGKYVSPHPKTFLFLPWMPSQQRLLLVSNHTFSKHSCYQGAPEMEIHWESGGTLLKHYTHALFVPDYFP